MSLAKRSTAPIKHAHAGRRAQFDTPAIIAPRGPASKVRIIGGAWRSRLLSFPNLDGLRPTGDRVRETLFNWLGQDLSGLVCLDVFAGSGALGFEAASRGAQRVVLCETQPHAARALEAARTLLNATQVEVLRADGLRVLQQARAQYDVIFADPPFAQDCAALVLGAAAQAARANGYLYFEQPQRLDELVSAQDQPQWRLLKYLKAGGVHAHLFQKIEISHDDS